jgi:hypothetical protein
MNIVTSSIGQQHPVHNAYAYMKHFDIWLLFLFEKGYNIGLMTQYKVMP